MGMVSFISRKTGQELQADFPLHPSLVTGTKPDGSTVQLFRSDWDAEFEQQLPTLPPVDVKALDRSAPAYEAPGVIALADLGKVPMSHHAWFQLLHDQLQELDKKISTILAIVEEDEAERDDDQDDDTQPR
jgi:hypothetical protein